MVRGNWQKRVESAEARRAAAKQRKQRRENRSVYKGLAQDLLAFLDKHGDAVVRTEQFDAIHLWTDSMPTNCSYEDYFPSKEEGPASAKKGHGVSESPGSSKKGRGRSWVQGESSTPTAKKKAHPHPRSSVPTQQATDADEQEDLLCSDHFFTGKCSNMAGKGKKASACTLIHYHRGHLTLAKVLHDGANASTCQQLELESPAVVTELSFNAMSASLLRDQDDHEIEGIDMVYHFVVKLQSLEQAAGSQQDHKNTSLAGILSEALSSHECPMGSLVYLSLNGWLLFDRYRGGLLVSDSVVRSLLPGGRRLRSATIVSENDEDTGHDESDPINDPIIHLPGQVLEYILVFLPDAAVATMSMVCHTWFKEIGKTSPNLWRQLLQRNDWPLPESVAHESERDRYRAAFLSHYGAVRNVRALQEGLSVLEGATKKVEEKEMVVQAFASRQGAPQDSNPCVGVKVWSANRVLAAYRNDCSLRLFETVAKATNDSSVRGCRETVSVRAAPSGSSKRAPWRLVAMGMDEEVIGCLCENPRNGEVILTIILRDDYLCAAGGSTNDGTGYSEVEFLQVVNVGDDALNYLLSCGGGDPRLLHLHDFLVVEGGEISDIDLLVTRTVIACGGGRFMLEVAISVPELGWDHDGDPLMALVTRKLLLFSEEDGAIVWMGDTNPLDPVLLRRDSHVSLAGHRSLARVDGSRTSCSVAVASDASTAILSIEMGTVGVVEGVHFVEGSDVLRDQLVRGGWEFSGHGSRLVMILPSDVVSADNLCRPVTETTVLRKGVLSFYPRSHCSALEGLSFGPETLVLLDSRILRVGNLGDNHVVVFCVTEGAVHSEQAVEGGAMGHWLGEPHNPGKDKLYAVVVHLPTRKEIQRVRLVDASFDEYDDIQMSVSGHTIGMGISWKGIILAGDDVRSVENSQGGEHGSNTNARKKKKKRQPNKGGKKDGFARGMSLRG